MHWPIHRSSGITAIAMALLLTACGDAPEPNRLQTPAVPDTMLSHDDEQEAFNQHLLHLANDGHVQLAASANALDDAIQQFLAAPDDAGLQYARRQWQEAYNALLRVRLFGYLPITDPVEWQRQRSGYRDLMQQLDSWPIEGGYLDYLPGYPHTGIVNDLALPLTTEALLQQHRSIDPWSASVGFHVVEFLLWGSDGQRPASDFLAAEPDPNNNAPGHRHRDRRRTYLTLASQLLREHASQLQQRWEPQTGYYARLMNDSLPSAALTAALIATQHWLDAARQHQQNEDVRSEFSGQQHAEQQALEDQALLQGLRNWLQGTNSDPGALPIVLADEPDLLDRWQAILATAGAQEAAPESASESAPENIPEPLTAAKLDYLQGLLDETATALNIRIHGY